MMMIKMMMVVVMIKLIFCVVGNLLTDQDDEDDYDIDYDDHLRSTYNRPARQD